MVFFSRSFSTRPIKMSHTESQRDNDDVLESMWYTSNIFVYKISSFCLLTILNQPRINNFFLYSRETNICHHISEYFLSTCQGGTMNTCTNLMVRSLIVLVKLWSASQADLCFIYTVLDFASNCIRNHEE
jgi:hypothetical protein